MAQVRRGGMYETLLISYSSDPFEKELRLVRQMPGDPERALIDSSRGFPTSSG